MAEDLPCFNLGFQILNVEKDEKSDWQLDKISTKNSNARFVRAWVNKTKTNFWRNHAKAKTTKSSTTWAVKVFKGMKKRKKNKLLRYEREKSLRTEIAEVRLRKKKNRAAWKNPVFL